ncbi:MAG: EAL domain-containing protein [Rhodoferax sp.]|nr:EAL domain-containing protein [Rhodoferax sp.]
MNLLASTYHPWGVVASILIATFASYVTLDLARRVQSNSGGGAVLWWAGGSVVMATGIWSMHFVGMLSFSLPITLGYSTFWTFLSWLAALAASGIALGVASAQTLNRARLVAGSLAMGAGISAMHYVGMHALDMVPGIVWDWRLVALSVVIAVAASATALGIFFWLRAMDEGKSPTRQMLSSLVMGAAIAGMHYTGMEAAGFPVGSVCRSADALGSDHLASAVALACTVVLLLALLTSQYDARVRRNTRRMEVSLQQANENLKAANDELRKRAFIDPLTGLANRLLFEDRLRHAVARVDRSVGQVASRNAEKVAVLFIDLDGFKPVNDSFGHAAGDAVLKEVAQRLRAEIRESDTAARVGGDEFLLLIEAAGSMADSVALAQRVLVSVARPYDLGTERVAVSASIGIAIHPDHGPAERIVIHADAAMYAAKAMGRNTYAVFESSMGNAAQEQMSLQSDLKNAVAKGQMELHYQPKMNGALAKFSGVEALLRWNHPERGQISPALFIPLAERFGLIGSLGDWIIHEACRQMAEWAQAGTNMRVAINVSAHQLRDPRLVQKIETTLQQHGVSPSRLLCEITESVAMEDVETTQRTFEGLAKIGVFLSIDDFGTGFSSLSYLRKLPARQLKIDKSFVLDLETSRDARAVVDAVIRLAHALSLRVVAEGVETQGQRDILLKMGCDELQGFLLARPMAARDLQKWIDGERPTGAPDFTPSVIYSELD